MGFDNKARNHYLLNGRAAVWGVQFAIRGYFFGSVVSDQDVKGIAESIQVECMQGRYKSPDFVRLVRNGLI